MVKPSRACPDTFCHRDQSPSATEHRNTTTPSRVTSWRGAAEKEVRFTRAYLVRLRMDHLDSPSSRGWTSNSTWAVENPIQEDNARKKAFFSRMASRVSTARRSRSLKSEARDMSMPVALLMRE